MFMARELEHGHVKVGWFCQVLVVNSQNWLVYLLEQQQQKKGKKKKKKKKTSAKTRSLHESDR